MKTVGVLGVGSIGTRHADNLHALGHTVFAYDSDVVTPIGRQSVIDDSDAVVIATPTKQHYQDLLDVMAARKPCFVEKPMAATQTEWEQLHNYLSTKAVFVGFNLRFHSCVQQVRQWLADDYIGAPLWANFVIAQHSDKPTYLRDGVILNWASHEIDLALYLLGPGRAVAAATCMEESVADIVIHHDNCQTTVHADYVTHAEIRQSVIVGRRGSIIMDLVSRNAWMRDDAGVVFAHHQGDDTLDDNYVAEMQAFLDRIDGHETIGATGDDGLAALRVCLDARKMAGLE